MVGGGVFAVADDRVHQDIGIEDVVAHRSEHLTGGVIEPDRILRLLEKSLDACGVVCHGLDHPKLIRDRDGFTDRGHGDASPGGDVRGDHLTEVHAVHVVCTDHYDDVGLFVTQKIEALEDRIRGTREPPFTKSLLSRNRSHVGVRKPRKPPGLRHVSVETVRLVLRQHHDLAEPGIDQVREGEVDETVVAAERHSGFRPICGKGHQAFAFPASEHDTEDLLGGHLSTVEEGYAVY